MHTAYVVVTIVAALAVGYSPAALTSHATLVVEGLADVRVGRPWWPWLALAKTAPAARRLAGRAVPVIGVAAEAGLIVYFAGAVATVVQARHLSHLP